MAIEIFSLAAGVFLIVALLVLAVIVERSDSDGPTGFTIGASVVTVIAVLILFARAGF